jgi:hypothetical protein
MDFFDTITEGISVPLTKLASGYKPVGLIGDMVYPTVQSITMSGKIPVFSSKDAFRIYNTQRARGAYSKRADINPDSWISFACEEHDLAIPLDQRELDALKALPGDVKLKALFNLQDRQRRRVQWNLKLELEQKIANDVQNTSTYSSDHVLTLANTTCWDQLTTSDPVANIETAREKIRAKTGVYPNTMIVGTDTERALKFHPAYTDLLSHGKDKFVDLTYVCAVHKLDKALVGSSMSVDSEGNFVDLWGDVCILAYMPKTTTPDIDEPSFGYTIRPNFSVKPYPYVDIFVEEGGKLVNVRCTDIYDIVTVMKDCGYLIKNTKK